MDIEKKDKNKVSFSIFLTSVLTFFALWVFLAEPIGELYVKNFKESDINVIKVNSEDLNLTKFWETYKLLKDKYYSLEWVQKDDLVDWAIAWMVDAIWDKHSQFMNKTESKSFNDALSWDFEWIWAVVEKTPIWVKIDRILKGSPAKRFWLKKNDIIISANWENVVGLNIWEAVEKIKWPAWTHVILNILRQWEKSDFEIDVTRAKIKIPTVESKEFDDNKNIWYIALNMYWQNSSSEFKKLLDEFKDKEWIIIDLRDNWGWYLTAAVEIVSNFIENEKEIVNVKWKNILHNTSYKSAGLSDKYKWKIVIIINWNSASASEITAWALRDYNKAILVWTKSYWKWSVQEPFRFSDGSQLKFTIAKWFTPNGLNIDDNWIEPDIKIEFKKEDYNYEECKKVWKCDDITNEEDFELYDRQLELAKDLLNDFISFWELPISISKFLEKNPEYETSNWSLEK